MQTGRQIGEVLPHVQYPTAGGSAAWTEDATGLWYTRFPGSDRAEADRHFFQTVWFHRVGTHPTSDRPVLVDGLPRVAEISMRFSPAARARLIAVANGDGGQFAHYVVDGAGAVHQVTRFDDDVDFVSFGPDRALYLVSERGAPHRQILRLPPREYRLAQARVVVPEGQDVIATEFLGEDALVFAGRTMAVRYLAGGPSRLGLYDLDGRSRGEVALPPISSVDEVEPLEGDLVYSVQTYVTPRTVRRRSPDGTDVETPLGSKSPLRYDDMDVTRATVRSRDGTNVPVNIVWARW